MRFASFTRAVRAAAFLLFASAAWAQQSDTVIKQVDRPRHTGVATLVPELTIGSADGAEEYTFVSANMVLPLRDGSVLVVDAPPRIAGTFRKYDSKGKFVRNIGRPGQGPGEYSGPGGLAQLKDGRILLLDARSRRINVYSEAGESIDTWPLDVGPLSIGGSGILGIDRNGYVTLRTSVERAVPTPGQRVSFSEVIMRFSTDGKPVDQIHAPYFANENSGAVSKSSTVAGGTSTYSFSAPYLPRGTTAWSPLGYYVSGHSARYAFEMLIPRAGTSAPWKAGDAVVSVRRNYAPVPVSAAERAERRENIEAQLKSLPGTQSGALPEFPREKPAYRGLGVADDGRIWVHLHVASEKFTPPAGAVPRSMSVLGSGGGAGGGSTGSGPGTVSATGPTAPPITWREPNVFDVFESDGTLIGRVSVPYHISILRRTGDTIWASVRDSDDVVTVQRLRISWGAR